MTQPSAFETIARPEAPAKTPRQFVNFCLFKLDPAWRMLSACARRTGREALLKAVEPFNEKVICPAYSMLGFRPEADFMLWRIAYALEDFEAMSSAIYNTSLGRHLTTPFSYLSQSKRS